MNLSIEDNKVLKLNYNFTTIKIVIFKIKTAEQLSIASEYPQIWCHKVCTPLEKFLWKLFFCKYCSCTTLIIGTTFSFLCRICFGSLYGAVPAWVNLEASHACGSKILEVFQRRTTKTGEEFWEGKCYRVLFAMEFGERSLGGYSMLFQSCCPRWL